MGRPTDYNAELAREICQRLSERSMVAVCNESDMPNRATVYRWLQEHEGFSDMYARAIKERGQYRAEKIEEISDKVLSGEYDPQSARVAMDGLKWVAAKLDNTKYGDRIHTEVSGSLDLNNKSDDELDRIIAERAQAVEKAERD